MVTIKNNEFLFYPFGSVAKGRSFSSAAYRYGFNGKEKDNEVKGTGNSIDYGMRIYDPRLGRFLSVDPLTWKYPELTPYQFASNRPIDGIDLDGLEYATYNITVHNGKVLDISVTTDYELKNAGTKGPGIQYNYIHLDEVGNAKGQPESSFVTNRYGIYGGENNPKLPEEGGDYKDTKDNYGLAPIDTYDEKFKTHDKDFDDEKIAGLKGTLSKESTPANEKLIKSLKDLKKDKAEGGKDKITGNDYSKEGSKFANKAKFFFKIVESFKKDAPKDKPKDTPTETDVK